MDKFGALVEKTVLAFDFDGTIVDTARESFLSSAKAYEEMTGEKVINKHNEEQYVKGRAFSLCAEANFTLIRIISETPKINFANYSQKSFDEEKSKDTELANVFVPLFEKHREAAKGTKEWFAFQPIFPEIKHALKNLSKKYSLYITTTNQSSSVTTLLDHYQVDIPREHIISDSPQETKEELLRKVAELEKVNMSSIILFDDAIKQLTAAKSAGAKTVLIMWGEKRQQFIDEAKKLGIPVVYTPKKCLSVIQSIEGIKKVTNY